MEEENKTVHSFQFSTDCEDIGNLTFSYIEFSLAFIRRIYDCHRFDLVQMISIFLFDYMFVFLSHYLIIFYKNELILSA